MARYVDLGDTAPAYSTWLNDPSYMKLETYFAEDQKGMLKFCSVLKSRKNKGGDNVTDLFSCPRTCCQLRAERS